MKQLPDKIFAQHIAVSRNFGPSVSARWPPVASLLFLVGPSAVVGAVRSPIVDAIKRVLRRRPQPHIGQEFFKSVAPPITNGDTTPAVVRIIWAALVVTAVFHPLPRVIFDRLTQTMGACGLASALDSKATTRQSFFANVVLPDCNFDAAIALTKPVAVLRIAPLGFSNNKQPSELVTGNNRFSVHECILPKRLIGVERLI